MSEVVRPCKNCGQELASHSELRRQLCGQEYLKKIYEEYCQKAGNGKA